MICNAEGCQNEAQETLEGKCRRHYLDYKYTKWLDNSDLTDQSKGIIGWSKEVLPKITHNSTPAHHLKIYQQLLETYSPKLRNMLERLLELIVFREGAKTSSLKVMALYLIAFNGRYTTVKINGEIVRCKLEEKFIVFMSETGDSAKDFTDSIREECTSKRFVWYHPTVKVGRVYDDEVKVWSKEAFKANGIYFLPRGWNQQIRGKLRGASRVSWLIADDIYSEKNTKTDTMLKEIRTKWNAAILNSMDTLTGKVTWACTLIHENTVSIDIKNDPQWETIELPVMNKEKFLKFVEKYLDYDKYTGEVKLRFDETANKYERRYQQRNYYDDIQNTYDWELAWPDRRDLYFLALKYQSHARNKTLSLFWQELFHIVIPDEHKRFRKDMFHRLPKYRLSYVGGEMWFECEELYGKEIQNIRIDFGVDLAGEKTLEKNDENVVTVKGQLPDNRIIIFKQFAAQCSKRDIPNIDNTDLRLDKVITDRTMLKSIGLYDEIFRMSLFYHPKEIKIGVAGEENAVIKDVERIFRANKDYITRIRKRPQHSGNGAKEERIINGMLGYYETGMVFHAFGLEGLEHQLEYLYKSTMDDKADSCECSFYDTPRVIKKTFIQPSEQYEKRDKNYKIDWRTI